MCIRLTITPLGCGVNRSTLEVSPGVVCVTILRGVLDPLMALA